MSVGSHVKSLLPQGLRNTLRPEVYFAQRAIQKMRQLTGQKGRLPDFLVLGAQKAGTTTLYDLIMQHPDAAPARTKEIAFFDRYFSWGFDWYKSNFPNTGKLTGEATPCYLYSQPARERISEHLPQTTKFIVLLRNPVDRAISHYYHTKRLGYETLSLEEALAAEPSRLNDQPHKLKGWRHENRSNSQSYSYIDRGRYADQITQYFSAFPRNQFFIETSDRFFNQPNDVMTEVFEFLELPRYNIERVKPKNIGVYSSKVAPHIYEHLAKEFADSNAELEHLLGRKLPW
jgi:hypothetical protein